jgi:type II secretory pathway component GspD/PulD (secretin)
MVHLKLTHKIMISFMCSMMLLSVSQAELLTDEKWSFDFKNVSILDAFNEIKKQTGIEIVVNQNTTQPIMITYRNKNQSIMQVHKDLLRNLNHVTSTNYSNDGALKSINIIIIGQGDGNVKIPGSNSINQSSGTTVEQKDLKANLAKPAVAPITGTTGEQNNVKTKLAKPPEPPKLRGVESPPMPPPGF